MRYILPTAGLDLKAPLPLWAAAAQEQVTAIFDAEDAVEGSAAKVRFCLGSVPLYGVGIKADLFASPGLSVPR